MSYAFLNITYTVTCSIPLRSNFVLKIYGVVLYIKLHLGSLQNIRWCRLSKLRLSFYYLTIREHR